MIIFTIYMFILKKEDYIYDNKTYEKMKYNIVNFFPETKQILKTSHF